MPLPPRIKIRMRHKALGADKFSGADVPQIMVSIYAAAAQVGLDQQLRATAEAYTVDLQVLEHPLYVVARLRERDALHPIDWIDLRVARVAEAPHPVAHPSAPGIVAGERQNVGAA